MTVFTNFLFTLSLLTMMNVVFAQPQFDVTKTDKKSFVLKVKAPGLKTMDIRLKSRKGEVLLKEEIKGEMDFQKKYRLDPLLKGEFTLFIENDTSTVMIPMAIKGNVLEISLDEQKYIRKPIFQPNKYKVDVVLLMKEKTSAEMYVFDEEGHIIFKDKGNYEDSVRKRFDMRKLEPGNYTIKVINNGVEVKETYALTRDGLKI